ncbi:4'-phosphopantetheinyl transferase family protein [Lysinibacillus sp. NPDC094177]|uniref:4'-phosphopantetheinyl transferase family protein n=1 Tax=Lysinibacillus sp. NPDC094177 TaxID=3390580 RepID=UPI003D089661
MIFVYNLELKNTDFSHQTKQLLNYVSIDRIKKIQSYKFSVDQLLSLYGELLVRKGIMDLTGMKNEEIDFNIGLYGKPYVMRLDGIFFNISHTRDCVCCCLSTKHQIGIDVERIQNPPYEIMRDFFHSNEIKMINSRKNDDRDNLFYEMWTRKEAYLKRKGIGINQEITKCDTLQVEDCFHTLRIKNYFCTICSEESTLHSFTELSERELHNYFIKE